MDTGSIYYLPHEGRTEGSCREEVKFFRSYGVKLLYLAKRIRPECLVAVAFLTTRMNVIDVNDMAK